MTISVPGNIILLGEYAVLEEGGLGLAAAVEKRVRLEAGPSRGLSVEGSWHGGSFRWTPGRRKESPLVTAVHAVVREWELARGRKLPGLHVRMDSSELYSPAGRKTGFGSSAAVSVALVAALRSARTRPRDRTTARLALEAHRRAQGGTGSGYDVYSSFFGGWGLFRGGRRPSWEPWNPGFGLRLYLFPGPAPVSTRDAIRSFREWKDREPALLRQFLEESNGNVMAFLSARGPRAAAAAFRKARETGIRLGDAIGVSARIPSPAGVDPELCKAVGAGNELGVYLALPGQPDPVRTGLLPVEIAHCGVLWQR